MAMEPLSPGSPQPAVDLKEDLARLNEYADSKLKGVFRALLSDLLLAQPEEPVTFMINFLQQYQKEQTLATKNEPLPVMDVPDGMRRRAAVRRRAGVSAESVDVETLSTVPTRVIHKTDEEKSQIRAAVANNFLFTSLEDDQMQIVISAMEKKEYKAGDHLIRQGDDGDDFYVLESGICECFLNQMDGSPKKVKVYEPGESFGELALMYNVSRQASIVAKTEVTAWAMDRTTFRAVLMTSTYQKRHRYEGFLSRVKILEYLDRYERAKVADALKTRKVTAGEYIIREGDTKDTSFYILASGEAKATKIVPPAEEPVTVMTYSGGDYFGELALLTDQPRAANVIATTDVQLVYLDRASFTRLLGPCEEILKRKKDSYVAFERSISI